MAITKRKSNLPSTIEGLHKWIIVGKAKVEAQKLAIKTAAQINERMAANKAALSDTQDLAEILLYAEARLGEMLEKRDKSKAYKGLTSSGGRKPDLPFGITDKQSHYAQELSRNEEAIARVVAKAREKGEVPVRQQVLRDIQENKPKPETPPLPAGKFNVIYADPPWKYSDKLIEGYGAAEHHYPAMSINELCDMPIKTILAENAVLFLWVTSPFLDECWPVVDAWGFEYKTSFVWDKVKHNYGHYNSVRHEILLVCTRGSFLPECQTLHDSVVTLERSPKHSEKPEYFRKLISSMYPNGKRLELFGRNKSHGWTVYGNEL